MRLLLSNYRQFPFFHSRSWSLAHVLSPVGGLLRYPTSMGKGISHREKVVAAVVSLDEVAAARERYYADHNVYERYATLRASKDSYVALRIDGRSFHTLTKTLVKPFDETFENAMDTAAVALMTDLHDALLAYVQSDEITLIFPPQKIPFDARVEKLTSVAASISSVAFSNSLQRVGVFDARTLVLESDVDVLALLSERQMDARKNAASVVAYWGLRNQGVSARVAERRLGDMTMGQRHDLLTELGLPFDQLSNARQLGRLLHWEIRAHTGFNPITQQEVATTRRGLAWLATTPDFRHLTSISEVL